MQVHFYSYFKDLAGTGELAETLAPGATLDDLLQTLCLRFPKLASLRNSMLLAVGVDYQKGDYSLADGDDVSLFPPVQGG